MVLNMVSSQEKQEREEELEQEREAAKRQRDKDFASLLAKQEQDLDKVCLLAVTVVYHLTRGFEDAAASHSSEQGCQKTTGSR
jgi:5-methylcytosine-specific restriction endonuclease McrBC GTP-binding regulatory subunit McrB